MSQFSEWQKEATPERKTVRVCFDRALLSRLEDAKRELAQIQSESHRVDEKGAMLGKEGDRVAALRARIEGLTEEVRQKSKVLVFQSIGRRAWRDLVAEFPPTPEQQEQFGQFGKVLDFNPETLPPVALSRCCVEPGLSIEQAQWLFEQMPLSVVDRIWAACLEANVTGSKDPFVTASDGAPASAKK